MNNKEKLAFSYPHLPNLNEGVGGREFHKIYTPARLQNPLGSSKFKPETSSPFLLLL